VIQTILAALKRAMLWSTVILGAAWILNVLTALAIMPASAPDGCQGRLGSDFREAIGRQPERVSNIMAVVPHNAGRQRRELQQ